MSQLIEAIVQDAERGKLRVLFGGDLCQARLAPVPPTVVLGAVLTLRIRVKTPHGAQVFEGAARVLKIDGVAWQEEALPLRQGLRLALEAPTFVRRPAPGTGEVELASVSPFEGVPNTVEERDPWSESGEMNDTVRLPRSEFWTGDTAKMRPAPVGTSPSQKGPGLFSSLEVDDLDDEGSGPWNPNATSSSLIR